MLLLLHQSRDNACELVSSLSAYESNLVYLEKNFSSDMIPMLSDFFDVLLNSHSLDNQNPLS